MKSCIVKLLPEIDNSDCLSGRVGTGQETQFFIEDLACIELHFPEGVPFSIK